MYRYPFPRPALSVDIVLFAGPPDDRRLLLVSRGAEPYEGRWALPGGFVDEGERLEEAARRELAEETGLTLPGPLVQVGAYGDPGRDPRGWTVSVAFGGDLGADEPPQVTGGDDAAAAAWHPLDDLPSLAFDHDGIVEGALRVLRVAAGGDRGV